MLIHVLQKLTVQNYQSHEHSEIIFSPKVTVITGKSQSGKTAILRALRWLAKNRPKGFRFQSHFAKREWVRQSESKIVWEAATQTQVALDVDDRTVTHIKSKSKEQYLLSGVKDPFKGAEVPDQISSLLNFTEINMQGQLDQPFLITSSPGEITRVINRVTKLDEVDKWNSDVTTMVNTANVKIGLAKEEIKVKEKKLKEYKGLEKIEEPLDRLDIVQNKINNLDIGIKLLSELVENLGWNEEEIESLKWVDEAASLLTQVTETETFISWIDSVLETDDRIYQLEEEIQVLDGIDDLFRELNGIVLWQGKYETLENIVQSISVIENEIKVIEKIKVSFSELNDIDEWLIEYDEDEELIWNFEETEKEVKELVEIVGMEKLQYTEKLRELKICPTCFGDMDDEAVKRIGEGLG